MDPPKLCQHQTVKGEVSSLYFLPCPGFIDHLATSESTSTPSFSKRQHFLAWEKILGFILQNHWHVLAIVLEVCSVVLELFLIRLILEMRSAAVLRTSHPLVSTWPVPLRGLKAAGVGADGPAGGTISSVLSHTLQGATGKGCIS